MIKYLSTFSGIGGFELGIQKAIPEAECIGYSEIDKYAIGIYKKHFPNHFGWGDITRIDVDKLPEFDLLVGGFPCQSFSIAGKRLGFEDTRGTMFFELARILANKRPRHFIFENVRGLLSHDGGKTFQTILRVLTELGYECQWQVLNSKDFGVPQNRERVFIVGCLRGESRLKVFPFPTNSREDVEVQRKEESERTWVPCLNTRYGQRWSGEGFVKGRYLVPSANKRGYEIAEEGDSIRLAHIGSETGRGRVGKQRSQALVTGGDMYTVQNSCIRRLTPLECERLQGFPDRWTEGVSDAQRYKCLGNAVTVNVIEAIVRRIYNQ